PGATFPVFPTVRGSGPCAFAQFGVLDAKVFVNVMVFWIIGVWYDGFRGTFGENVPFPHLGKRNLFCFVPTLGVNFIDLTNTLSDGHPIICHYSLTSFSKFQPSYCRASCTIKSAGVSVWAELMR